MLRSNGGTAPFCGVLAGLGFLVARGRLYKQRVNGEAGQRASACSDGTLVENILRYSD